MAEIQNATSVEQLLGRVLRQPNAARRKNQVLNQSYAYAVSRDFSATAAGLRDRLVENAGFDAQEADAFVSARRPEQQRLNIHRHSQRIEVRPVIVTLSEKPDFKTLPKSLKAKISWDNKAKELTLSEPINEEEAESLAATVLREDTKKAIAQAVETSQKESVKIFESPSQRSEPFSVPELAVWINGELQLFDDPEVIDYPYELSFVSAWLGRLLQKDEFDPARANRQKFLLRQLLENRIKELLKLAAQQACQQFLFSDETHKRVSVSDAYRFTFNPDTYIPSREHPEPLEFNYHYYPVVGDFDNSEENDLACWLDQQAHRGRIKFWVRNLVRKPGASFSLQTSTDRFYPDFVCMLPEDRILVIESKGAHLWKAAEEDRKIGKLWAEMSKGKCLFVMVKERKWEWIDSLLT